MEMVTLSNGVEMPILGFGVYQIPKEDCERCVLEAITAGYRHIDTAQSYFNEEEVGNAIIHSGVDRKELFITTKVWVDNYGYEKTKESIKESLRKLKTDYLDLVLLHQPFGDTYASYRALEDLVEENVIRAIGVSNFYPDRLADLAAFNRITPHVNQVETNPFHQQLQAQKEMINRNIQMEAWAPFGEGRNHMFNQPVLVQIASNHHKSVAQVILRWLIQRHVVVLAKSVQVERMKENLDIFNFELSKSEMDLIQEIDTKTSLFFNHQTPETVEMFVQLIQKRRNQ